MEKVYGGNDLVKSQVLSSEWKTDRVREDASGDREDGKEDEVGIFPYRLPGGYPLYILSFRHIARVWQTGGWTDGQTELRSPNTERPRHSLRGKNMSNSIKRCIKSCLEHCKWKSWYTTSFTFIHHILLSQSHNSTGNDLQSTNCHTRVNEK